MAPPISDTNLDGFTHLLGEFDAAYTNQDQAGMERVLIQLEGSAHSSPTGDLLWPTIVSLRRLTNGHATGQPSDWAQATSWGSRIEGGTFKGDHHFSLSLQTDPLPNDSASSLNPIFRAHPAEVAKTFEAIEITAPLINDLQTIAASLAVGGASADEFFDAVDGLTLAVNTQNRNHEEIFRAKLMGALRALSETVWSAAISRIARSWSWADTFPVLDPFMIEDSGNTPQSSGHEFVSVTIPVGPAHPEDAKAPPPSHDSPIIAMPGLGLSLSLSQSLRLEQRLSLTQQLRQELKLELRLELQLSQRQELQADQAQSADEFYDDLWPAESVPSQIIEIDTAIAKMAVATTARDYVELAGQVLGLIDSITLPFFRMMGVCHLAEELSHHEALKNYAQDLYATHFTKNFSAVLQGDRPSLALMVAVSQLRAGLPAVHVKNLVIRAMALAKLNNVELRGRDTRNFEYILKNWPKTEADFTAAQEWVGFHVQMERWVARPMDIVQLDVDESSAEEASPPAVTMPARAEPATPTAPPVAAIELTPGAVTEPHQPSLPLPS